MWKTLITLGYGSFLKDLHSKCDNPPKIRGWAKPEHYITIELGVRDMPLLQAKTSLHKQIHVLML